MVALLEHTDTALAHSGIEVDIETIQDEPVVLLSPHGDLLLANKVRIIEFNSWDLVAEEADDLEDLDRIENELSIMIAWLRTMPESEDRDFMLEDLIFELGEVPYAREMLELEIAGAQVYAEVD